MSDTVGISNSGLKLLAAMHKLECKHAVNLAISALKALSATSLILLRVKQVATTQADARNHLLMVLLACGSVVCVDIWSIYARLFAKSST